MLQSRSTAALVALSCLATTAFGGAQDPFEPGLRWVRPAYLGDAWIPTSVGFAADDQLCWSVSGGVAPRVGVESSAQRGLAQPLFEEHLTDPIAGTLSVSTCTARDGLFVLKQTFGTDPTERDTHVSRYDALAAASGAPFAPKWTLDFPLEANGPARLLTDDAGELGFVLLWDDDAHELFVCRVDLVSGGLLDYQSYPASSLDSAALSADGSRLAIVCGTTLHILDRFGLPVDQRSLYSATPAISLDEDGSHLLVGGIGAAQLLTEQANGYQESLLLSGGATELAKLADLSADGSVLAIGWWNYANGVDARFEAFDGETGDSLRELALSGTPGGLQNSPSALEVSADGQRIACGSWGAGGEEPELVLLDLGQDEPVLEANLPGSVLHLDLDETGTRVLVAAKHLHANQFGVTGELRLYDTGERDLQLLTAPRPGGRLHLAAEAVDATAAWFLVGREQDAPFANGLALVRQGLRVISAPVTEGVAELDVPLPAGQRLLGLTPTIQAALRRGGELEFSSSLVRPFFL